MNNMIDNWLTNFRTAGLQSWRLRFAKETDAGKMLVKNYAAALTSIIKNDLKISSKQYLELFRWYQKYLVNLIPSEEQDKLNEVWNKRLKFEE